MAYSVIAITPSGELSRTHKGVYLTLESAERYALIREGFSSGDDTYKVYSNEEINAMPDQGNSIVGLY